MTTRRSLKSQEASAGAGAHLVRDLLRAEVLQGAFPAGVLPSETELMLDFGASRAVVRAALDMLRHDGVIERRRGIGTLVVSRRYEMRLIDIHGLGDPMRGTRYSTRVLQRRVIRMSSSIASRLDEAPGTACLRLEYLTLADSEPQTLATSYLRFPEATAIGDAEFTPHWFGLLANAGIRLGESELLIEAVLADPIAARLLAVPAYSPLIALQQIFRLPDCRPFGYAVMRARSDSVSVRTTSEPTAH